MQTYHEVRKFDMHHKLLRRFAKVLCSMTDHALESALQFLPLAQQKSGEAVHEWLVHAEAMSAGAEPTVTHSAGTDGSDNEDTEGSAREEIGRSDDMHGVVVIDSDVEEHKMEATAQSVDATAEAPPETMEQLFHAVQACCHLLLVECDIVIAFRRASMMSISQTRMRTHMWGDAAHHVVLQMQPCRHVHAQSVYSSRPMPTSSCWMRRMTMTRTTRMR